MIRSFRFQLAARFAVAMTLATVALAALSLWAVAFFLDRELNASLVNVASIQAATVTDAPDGAMHFHEWELTPDEARSIQDLIRYAQVWSASGESLLRSQFLTRDLPLDTAALRHAASGNLVWSETAFQGTPVRALYYPLERLGPSHAHHVLEVAAPLRSRNRMVRRLAFLLLGIVLLVAFGTAAGGWWLGGRAVRPVHEITDQAEAISAGTLERRIHAYADTREYMALVRVLNTMLGRLHSAFEAQRRFTADASHELRSPLTAIRGEVEVALRRDRPAEEYRQVLQSTLEEVDRLSEMADDLLALTRADAGVMEPRLRRLDLAEATAHVVERLAHRAQAKQIAVRLDTDGDTTGLFDRDQVERLIWNLVDNAIKFTTAGGHVDVAVTEGEGEVVLEVADSGPGIREADLERIFERFYRADLARSHADATDGTGLGLSIVHAVAEAHGGTVGAANRPGGGAQFTVHFPSSVIFSTD